MRSTPSRTLASWAHLAIAACYLLPAAPLLIAQNPAGFVQSDQWACLVPLQGNDCTGGGPRAMAENWVAPRDIATENPVVGTVWSDIDFGGAAKSAAYRGAGDPTFVNVGLQPDPNAVDWNLYCSGALLTDDFVLGIAVTYVNNTTGAPLPVGLCTASDDSVQVWVQNALAVNLSVCRGTAPDCAEVTPAVLAPGVNRIAVLVWEGFGGFGFRFGFTKPDGSKYTQADPEIEYLGASAGGAAVQPIATRSYARGDYLSPNASHQVEILGSSSYADGTTYRVCENLRGREGLRGTISTESITSISDGGSATNFLAVTEPVGEFIRYTVGFPCSPDNNTTFDGDIYTTRATTGIDIWADGDAFEFAYKYVEGDFDISVEVVDRRFPPTGRWGKFGLMARQSLDYNSKFAMIQDHGPDLQDPARFSSRIAQHITNSMVDPANTGGLTDPVDASSLMHPAFLRLTRRGDLIESWVSNTAGVAPDPANDAAWMKIFGDDWTGGPIGVYLGFAYSVHNSSGCATGEIDWRVLAFDGAEVPDPGYPVGVDVCWDATGATLKGGLAYTVSAGPGTVVSVLGNAGPTVTQGPRVLTFQTGATGPIGAFDDSHDIGERGPCSPGSLTHDPMGAGDLDDMYTMTASGYDIWAGGDQLHFGYKRMTGDFAVQAHFPSVAHPIANGRWGKYGLMARWDARPNSAYFFTHNAGATNFNCEIDGPRTAYRPFGGANGGNGEPDFLWWQDVLGSEPIDIACAPLNPDIRAGDLRGDERNLPAWLRMVRRGNAFYGYASDDGVDWRILGAYAWIDPPDEMLVGVAMTSHANCDVQIISFDNLSMGPPAPIEPDHPEVGPDGLPGGPVFETDFEELDGSCPAGWICNRWGGGGGFGPQTVEGRLRMGEIRNGALGSGEDTGTTAFLDQTIDPDGSYVFDFDVFFSYDILAAGDNNPPADGLTFTVVGTGTGTDSLDLRLGDRGGSVGYGRINLSLNEGTARSRDFSYNSFAVEFDNWHNGNGEALNEGDGGNVSGWIPTGGAAGTGTGAYHVNLDVNASICGAQRNISVGLHDDDLPDIYDPAGIHARVVYDQGHVRAWVQDLAVPGAPYQLVIDSEIDPLEFNASEALVGFTAATGGATCIMEVDNFRAADLNLIVDGFLFRRGDSNASGDLNITDGVFVLNYLFLGGPEPPCQDAADSDDNGSLNITDGVRILNYLFLGGPAPPAPGPETCGSDPTTDDLPVCTYESC